MSFAQIHLRSALYALATGPGSIMDRLRDAEDSLMKAENFNEFPSDLRNALIELRQEILSALREDNYPENEASRLAGRVFTLYEKIHDAATH